ncbi:hypothetical protein ACFOD8_02390 [Arthrobacter agilis]|uniref:hypothetical protein n=1 Tax=Arthrobacter agilis TaxID=37921 RepID=UPI001476A276|nr:hypothetical protein [Arthrobacter agilis]
MDLETGPGLETGPDLETSPDPDPDPGTGVASGIDMDLGFDEGRKMPRSITPQVDGASFTTASSPDVQSSKLTAVVPGSGGAMEI